MSDRSKRRHATLRLPLAGLLICALMLAACQPANKREKLLRKLVDKALDERYMQNDYEAYMQRVDYGEEPDSVERQVLIAMHRQFADYQQQRHGAVARVETVGLEYAEGDTVCYVHYMVTYSDSVQEAAMLKAVFSDSEWKIRGRN